MRSRAAFNAGLFCSASRKVSVALNSRGASGEAEVAQIAPEQKLKMTDRTSPAEPKTAFLLREFMRLSMDGVLRIPGTCTVEELNVFGDAVHSLIQKLEEHGKDEKGEQSG